MCFGRKKIKGGLEIFSSGFLAMNDSWVCERLAEVNVSFWSLSSPFTKVKQL